ncbi:MAG: gephyrin-like molybdotransferase Glp [Desulfatiglandales bacterium]
MFFKVKTTEEVLEILDQFEPVGIDALPLIKAFGRVLGEDFISQENLPGFSRTSMDGYAVKAKDTYGATESLPALLEVGGEVLMGGIPSVVVRPGQAVRISTGGMLPEGADAVVMIEYCHALDEKTIEVSRAVSPQENIIQFDDDIRKDALVLPKGRKLRSQDLGVMAALGQSEVSVYRRPRIAIVSTGDEVVPIDQSPGPGQVRDINTYTLSAFCELNGAEPVALGLCGDDFDELQEMVVKGLEEADSVWISGGSSVGTRDLTVKVFESLDSVDTLVHGISISPGKPTIIARSKSQAIFGLPGHAASAMVVAEVFLTPFLAKLAGKRDPFKERHQILNAKLSRNIESAGGRDDYIRVKLIRADDEWMADPIFGKSALISTLVEADGLLRVDRNTEGLYQDQIVQVMVI